MQFKTQYSILSKLESFYEGGAAALSANGLIACAHNDVVKVLSATTAEAKVSLAGDSEILTAVCFSSDSKYLYGASRSQNLLCWELSAGKCIRTWKGHTSSVAQMATDTTGSLLATGAADRTARVWDLSGYYCTHVFRGHRAAVVQVLLLSQEMLLVSAAEDGEICLWDLVTRTCRSRLKEHFAAVTALSISTDGWTLLSAARDKVAILWDLRSNTRRCTVPIFEAVEGAQFHPAPVAEGQQITADKQRHLHFVTGGERGIVKLWDGMKGTCVATCSVEAGPEGYSRINALSVDESCRIMVTTTDARIILIQPEVTGSSNTEGTIRLAKQAELIGDQGDVTDLKFLGPPSDPTHIAVATNSVAIRVYNISLGSCEAVLRGHEDVVLALDAVYKGNGCTRLASGSKDASWRLWDLQADSNQGEATRTAAISVKCLGSVKGHTSSVTAVLLTQNKPSKSILLSASSDRMLKVWKTSFVEEGDLTTDSLTGLAAHAKDINSLTLSPDETLVCSTSQDRTAKIWRLPALVLGLTLQGHKRGVWAAAFSPVEKTVATASADRTFKLWALKDGSCLRTFQGHNAAVLRLLYVTSGMQVVTSGADGLVKLWNIRSNECETTLEEHVDRVWALVSAGEDGALLASGGSDAKVCIWQDTTRQRQEDSASSRTAAAAAQQEFLNAVQAGDLKRAAFLAFEGNQLKKLLSTIEALQQAYPGQSQQLLKDIVSTFSPDQLKNALEAVRDWNTRAQSCQQAQAVLQAVLSCHRPQDLVSVRGLGEILAGLETYTQRHMAHAERLLLSGSVIDYTLHRMRHVHPQNEQTWT